MKNRLPSHGYYGPDIDDVQLYLNLASRPTPKNKFSKFRGVHKSNKIDKPYRAALCYKGRRYIAGNFACEIEAAKAYNKIALAVIGERALLNEFNDGK